jgi:group I intron endonuclease
MIIYRITNNINGKIYIGQTKKALSQRIAEHIKGNAKGNKTPVHRALNKYGLESFTISVIDEADTKEILNEKEIYWIKTLDCKIPKGYNIANGGNGVVGYKHTKKWKKEAAIRFSGDNNPTKRPEVREKISKALTGKHPSEETKKNMSKASKGKSKSEEHKKNISKSLIGHTVSEETAKKISKSATGRTNSKESNEKRRKTQTGKPHVSEEAKQRMSIERTGVPRTEEAKANMRKPKSPEGRANIAASNKRRAEEKKQNQKENK